MQGFMGKRRHVDDSQQQKDNLQLHFGTRIRGMVKLSLSTKHNIIN